MIKLNLEKLKEKYLIVNNAFAWIKETTLGKFILEKILFRSKSFYSVFYSLILILISQLSALKYAEELASKIDEQIKTSEGFINFLWRIADFFAPDGNGYIIALLVLVIPVIFWLRNKELNDINSKAIRSNNGWYPYENWANPSQGVEEEYIISDKTIIFNEKNEEKPLLEGLNELREKLSKDKSAIRLVGLSGVGKTRFVQAIFDDRIGDNVPDASLVCYTDMSKEPDPSPIVMAEQLVGNEERGILIVDNCPPNLHRELVKTIGKDGSQISLLTIEYDVREDLPEETDVFKLEPNSLEVIEKIIEKRFEHISQIDARNIAEFSGGNARIAIALANTIKRGDTLSGLRDEELFKRLFHQRNDSSEKLIQSAEVLSLVYSFNGKEVNEQSELAFMATLIDKTTNDLYRDVEELKKRELIQVRGDWKAVLPQAISNRLAKQAMESLPQEYIVEKFITTAPERLIKSFAHRLSFLHDSEIAINIVEKWLENDGWLGKSKCDFNDFEMDIFKYITPVAPEKALECMESVADEKFFNPENNKDSMDFVSLLRHIAYDPDLFDRAVNLICKFAVFEKKEDTHNTIQEILKTLFWLYLSGTRATTVQRLDIIKNLLNSEDIIEQKLGFTLLDASLETDHFTSHHSFDFGARSRNFGWEPKTQQEMSEWYATYITLMKNIALSDHTLANNARHLFAQHFRGLWYRAYSFDLIVETAKTLHDSVPWTEGWLAIKETIYFDSALYSPEILKKIENLENHLSPQSLYAKAQVHIISDQYHSKDCLDLEEKSDQEKCQKKLDDDVYKIGTDLANNKKILNSLLPEIVKSNNFMLSKLILGIASEYTDQNELWSLIYDQYKKTPKNEWNTTTIFALFNYWAVHDLEMFHTLMDLILNDNYFYEYYPSLQSILLDEDGIKRLHHSLELGKTPLSRYACLGYSNKYKMTSDKDLAELISHILLTENSYMVALEILNGRFHSKSKERPSKELLDLSTTILLEYPYKEDDNRSSNDYKFKIVASTCFKYNPDKTLASAICKNIADSQGISLIPRFNATLTIISKYFPTIFLDCCLNNNFIVNKGVHSLNTTYSQKEANSIYDSIEDKYILEWCDKDPEPRYQFIASIINPLDMIEETLVVKPLVYSILDRIDNKIDVLNNFITSRGSWSFTSQRVETFDSKKVLFQELKDHDNAIIKEWAEEELKTHLLKMGKIHDLQKNESKSRFERFE